jgi:hypothetical protein
VRVGRGHAVVGERRGKRVRSSVQAGHGARNSPSGGIGKTEQSVQLPSLVQRRSRDSVLLLSPSLIS